MNPVLIKPSGECRSQVVVMGQPYATASARSYQELKRELQPIVDGALADLRSRFDVVVCEGAGSPAEINLRDGDLTNMGLARRNDMPVIVVADIDRGGVMASLFGTLALLDPADQAHVSGFVVNKFRGDLSILEPGLVRLEELTAAARSACCRTSMTCGWMSRTRSRSRHAAPRRPPRATRWTSPSCGCAG